MPAVAWTYTTLRAAIQAWPSYASTDFVSNLDTMIGLGEVRLTRDLNLEIFDADDASVSTAAGNRLVNKPASCVQVRDVGLIVSGQYRPLERRSLGFMRMYAPDATAQGVPAYWIDSETDAIYVVPTPDAVYSVNYRYVTTAPDVLTSVDPDATSWLSSRVPDALFAACLMEAEHFLKADDRYADMRTKYYEELLPAARAMLRISIRDGDYAPMKPVATTLKGA